MTQFGNIQWHEKLTLGAHTPHNEIKMKLLEMLLWSIDLKKGTSNKSTQQ